MIRKQFGDLRLTGPGPCVVATVGPARDAAVQVVHALVVAALAEFFLAEPSLAELSPAELSPVEPSPVEPSPAQVFHVEHVLVVPFPASNGHAQVFPFASSPAVLVPAEVVDSVHGRQLVQHSEAGTAVAVQFVDAQLEETTYAVPGADSRRHN
jgi:hypothetical protein